MLQKFKPELSQLQSTAAPSSSKRDHHLDLPLQTLAIRQGRASDAGNTLATAKPLRSFPGKAQVRDRVGRSDKDIFKLTFNDFSDFSLTVENLSKVNLSAVLLNSQGQALASGQNRRFRSVQAGQTVKGLYAEVPAGTYYLQLQSRGEGQNTYKLSIAVANTFPDFPPCGCADPAT